jgi:hypothetical protein
MIAFSLCCLRSPCAVALRAVYNLLVVAVSSHRRATRVLPPCQVDNVGAIQTVGPGDALILLTGVAGAHLRLIEGAAVLLLRIEIAGVRLRRGVTASGRIFSAAQVAVAPRPVQYALGADHIASRTAMRLVSGTTPRTHFVPVERAESYSRKWALYPYASIGKRPEDARENTISVTSARDAENPPMEPILVLERRKSEAVTPYKWQAWEAALAAAGLSSKYPDVIRGLREGFVVNFPKITYTQIPPNRPSVREFRSHFDSIVANEHAKGRYIGPFTRSTLEEAIGPFQCSPFSIIPKAGRIDKFRIIQNFSFPISPSFAFPNCSVNSTILSSDFPSTWGTFEVTCAVIVALPPGSQIAVRDVSEAYRTIPLHHSQWPAGVAHVDDDTFFVDVCCAFGACPSGGGRGYGGAGDTEGDLFRARGMGPLHKWVDDNVFFRMLTIYLPAYNQLREQWKEQVQEQGCFSHGGRRWYGAGIQADGSGFEAVEDFEFPLLDLSGTSLRDDAEYSYNFDDIDRLSRELGIPWETSKDIPFSSSAVYIGLTWDLTRRAVGLPEQKRTKYLASVYDWLARETHTLEDVQKLYGRLLHATLVFPAGRSRLVGFESMLGIFKDTPFVPRHVNKSIAGDLIWWSTKLKLDSFFRPIPSIVNIVDCGAFSDASSEVGIGIIVNGRWRAWRLLPGWKTLNGSRDISWAEAIGFELLVDAVLLIAPLHKNYRLYGDNKGVVEGWWNRRSRNHQVNEVFKSIQDKLERRGLTDAIHTSYVPSKSNPADGPSRGIFPSASLLLPPLAIPFRANGFLIDAQEPLTAAEIHHRCHGTAIVSLPRTQRHTAVERGFNNDHFSDAKCTGRAEWGSSRYTEGTLQ